jgi:CBS domain-containing protein
MLVKDAMHPRTLTINGYESLPDAVVKMQTFDIKRLPVLHEGKLVGLLTDTEIKAHLPAVHEGLSPWAFAYRAGMVKVSTVMCPEVLTVSPEEPLEHAIKMLLDRRVGGLPVLDDDGHLVGMLTLTDVLRAEVKSPRLKWGSVHQNMTVSTISVTASSAASEAAAKLKVSGLKVFPVLEGEQLVGVLHEKDLRATLERAQAAHGDTMLGDQFFLEGVTVRDLMRPPGGYVLDSLPMRDAIERMLEADVHGLPVISEGGRLLGIVTISDVLKTLLGEQQVNRV